MQPAITSADSHEEQSPEITANPALLHFLDIIRDMALDPDSQIPKENTLIDTLFGYTMGCKDKDEAVKQIAKQFPVQVKVCLLTNCCMSLIVLIPFHVLSYRILGIKVKTGY